MATINEIQSLKAVLANLQARQERLETGFVRGIKLAGLMLQRDSQKKVPVDLGNLKNSAFTRPSGAGYQTVVSVGYTAAYALYVHEAVGMKLKGQPRSKPHKGKYWDPQGRAQAKFLEEPFRRLQGEMLAMIKQNMKIV